jgi:hypothetical protein
MSLSLRAAQRTGPIGRIARAVLAGGLILTFMSIADWRGSSRFRNPHVLTEWSVWFLDLLMFTVFLILVGALASAVAGPRARTRWQILALLGFLMLVAVTATLTWLIQGAVWGFPLADLVWWFDVLMVVEEFFALVLAIGLGTPGCEIGVWPELLARARGRTAGSETGLACIVGLHLIDAWEARRPSSRREPAPKQQDPQQHGHDQVGDAEADAIRQSGQYKWRPTDGEARP